MDLPESGSYSQIWVVVDHFMKMAHFIPLPVSINMQELAKRFTQEIWKLHELPEEIISDHNPKFTSYFWATLMEILGVSQKLSTAFYSETDDQTK